MQQSFQKDENEVIQHSVSEELKQVENSIRELSDRRNLLRSVLDKVKGQRPADYVELAPVRKMFAPKFEDNNSMASRINFILAKKNRPMNASEITDEYISLVPELKKKRPETLKNIATILSIGRGKKYDREKANGGKFAYSLMEQMHTA